MEDLRPVAPSLAEEPAAVLAPELSNSGIIIAYLMERVPEFRALDAIRRKGWADPALDTVFQEQRHKADNASVAARKNLCNMMVRNAEELNAATGGFSISRVGTDQDPVSIVDFCMAPGAFLNTALLENPGSRALAFTLPVEKGGHEVQLPDYEFVSIYFMDVNLLAADMGVAEIPDDDEEADEFLPRFFTQDKRSFNMALCDGQVLRTHSRAPYRERREAQRLTAVQLALGLGHLRTGGTMIVLLHKIEEWRNVRLLHQFSKFSKVKVFKPSRSHTTRASFYMIATDIKVLEAEAIEAVRGWKKLWQVATFGTEDEFEAVIGEGLGVSDVLDQFGGALVELGRDIWKIQGDALVERDEKGWNKENKS